MPTQIRPHEQDWLNPANPILETPDMSLFASMPRLGLLAFALTLPLVSPFGTTEAHAKPSSSSHVYMFPGLLGITGGLEDLAAKLRRRGVETTMAGSGSTETAIQGYKSGQLRSIVIIGYSAGGSSAMEMAAMLDKAKVPVQLVVMFDPSAGPDVPPNVHRLVNFLVPGGIGAKISRPKNFGGVIQEVRAKDPNIGHFSLIDTYQRQALELIVSAAGRSGGAPARSAGASPSPAQ